MQYFDYHFPKMTFVYKVSHSSVFNWQHNEPKMRGIGGFGCEEVVFIVDLFTVSVFNPVSRLLSLFIVAVLDFSKQKTKIFFAFCGNLQPYDDSLNQSGFSSAVAVPARAHQPLFTPSLLSQQSFPPLSFSPTTVSTRIWCRWIQTTETEL